MLIKLSDDMQHAVEAKVRLMLRETLVIDTAQTAEEIRRAFADRNVAHEDIVAYVTRFAMTCGYPLRLAGQKHAN